MEESQSVSPDVRQDSGEEAEQWRSSQLLPGMLRNSQTILIRKVSQEKDSNTFTPGAV